MRMAMPLNRSLIHYNLPFLLWLGWTLLSQTTALPGVCFMRQLLPYCPGCGLTRDFAHLLSGERPHGYLIYFVLSLFLVNGIVSLLRVQRHRKITSTVVV